MGLKTLGKAFLYFSFISVMAVPLAVFDQLDSGNSLLLILVGLGVTLLAAAVFFALVLLWGRGRQSSSTLILIALVIAGVIRGVAMFQAFDELGLRQPSDITTRVLASTATTLIWFLLILRVVEEFDGFRARYSTTLNRKLFAFAASESKTAQTNEADFTEDANRLQSLLAQALDPVSQHQFSKADLLSAAARLRTYVDEVVRPLSRQIWLDRNSLPRFRRGYLVRRALTRPEFNPIPPAAFVSGITVANLTVTQSLVRGLIAALILFTLLVPIFKVINLINKSHTRGIFINTALFLLPGIISGFVFLNMNRYIFEDETGLFSWYALPIIFISGLVASMLHIVRVRRDLLIDDLERIPSSDLGNRSTLNTNDSNRFASYLHNTLQSELLALSHQLEQAALDPTSRESQAIQERLHSTLGRSIADHFKETRSNPKSRLTTLVGSWAGLLRIELHIDAIDRLERELQELIVATIEEAITNSFRHGKASELRAELEIVDSSTLILGLWSDSQWTEPNVGGLGQEWISANYSSWERQEMDGGSLVKLTYDLDLRPGNPRD